MTAIVRFGISLDRRLLAAFDRRIAGKGYNSRSEAIRDLIREELIREEWSSESGDTAGAIVLMYDHHQRRLLERITDLQHAHQGLIISTSHTHLDHRNCLEIIAVRGAGKQIMQLADHLKALKGVKHGALSLSTTGKEIV